MLNWKGWKNMNRKEIIEIIKRNKIAKREAIILIADFLVTNREIAQKIYQEEFENI